MTARRITSKHRAFTLIEVLVATFILVVMVLILSKVYHQASVAWSAGFRRAEGNMTGRSAVGFMARELMGAVADRDLFNETAFWDGYQSVRFISLAGEPEAGRRAARWITYECSTDGALMRIEKEADVNNHGSWVDVPNGSWVMVTNVESCYFYTPGGNYMNGRLPEWIRIKLTLRRQDDVSGVGASSAGPDGTRGNDDDIESF